MNPGRSTFIRDQLQQRARQVATGVRHAGDAKTLGPHDLAAHDLIARLIAELRGGMPLCDHLTADANLYWAPGMLSLACWYDLVAYTALHDQDLRCDLCGAVNGPGAHQGRIHGGFVAAGPVAIAGYFCSDCAQRGTAPAYDVAAIHAVVLDLVEDAYWRAATGDGPGAA